MSTVIGSICSFSSSVLMQVSNQVNGSSHQLNGDVILHTSSSLSQACPIIWIAGTADFSSSILPFFLRRPLSARGFHVPLLHASFPRRFGFPLLIPGISVPSTLLNMHSSSFLITSLVVRPMCSFLQKQIIRSKKVQFR